MILRRADAPDHRHLDDAFVTVGFDIDLLCHDCPKGVKAGIIRTVVVNTQSKTPDVSLARAFFQWRTLVAFIVTGLVIYAFFHGFKRDDLIRLRDYLHNMKPWAFALAFVFNYLGYMFFGLKYKILLENRGVKISVWQASIMCLMNAAINAGVPVMIGDMSPRRSSPQT